MKTIALIAPNQAAYSETFIQAHKNLLNANVRYYYDGKLPHCLEGEGPLQPTRFDVIRKKLSSVMGRDACTSLHEDLLIESFKKNRIEKVYAEYGPTAVAVLNVCKKMNMPLIVNFHGYDISVGHVIDRYREPYWRMLEYAESIVAVSRHMFDPLVELGADRQKITYTPCAPQDSFFEVQPRFSEAVFIAAGRFVNKKAPYYTVLAFVEVLKKHPGARLLFAGSGPLLPACRNIVRYHGCDGAVIFLGDVDSKTLQQLYASATGFVQHSITAEDGDMEGTPVSVLEASAAGLPVVSTMHAGIPGVVVDGQTGLLVQEHDVERMAQNMIRLLDDREYAKSLGRQGREFVRNNFSMEKHIGVLNGLINK
jgi:glycosyltransferase involved in cell wall biosynthesis